jgi:pyruvate kinase
VKSVEGNNVKCTAQNDAVMDGLLTVTHHSANEENRMSMQADLPLLSEHDVHAIRDITTQFEVDFVALTFTRDGEDVDGLRDFLDKLSLEQTKIMAKVENQAALYNFAGIATAADGVIISRGNLGLDVAPEKMARVQKEVISKCNLLGKPVIITRVVDTMATAPRPTRYTKARHCLLTRSVISTHVHDNPQPPAYVCCLTLAGQHLLSCIFAVSWSNKAMSKMP